jgi:hypothetical protein
MRGLCCHTKWNIKQFIPFCLLASSGVNGDSGNVFCSDNPLIKLCITPALPALVFGGQQFPLSVIQDIMFNSLNNLAIWSLTIYMKT